MSHGVLQILVSVLETRAPRSSIYVFGVFALPRLASNDITYYQPANKKANVNDIYPSTAARFIGKSVENAIGKKASCLGIG
ncbi:Hypothetical protein NTJ_02388 [Nesidiocoris tenuis]|uniref:Uncharacterized protein n=1 Tax=Nesidiocoris tenuis TaxID=355587 RepID=A0ABN7AFC8_9HEMI|nr:Hypothetical protein NTJ_02388 [Nesidiocoris tenuis]